jgi:multicomponent Na+:H+ antiporter subunit E
MVLTANFEMANIFIGMGVSFTISFVYTKMFKSEDKRMINPYYLLIYLLILMKNLIISNIQITKRILSVDMKLCGKIVEVKTTLSSEYKKLLLANSITLTPGTLTLDIKDDTLYIHVIEFRDGDNEDEIIKEFEEVIKKI